MKNVYFEIYDTTKKYGTMKEEKHRFICDSEFCSVPVGNDLAGCLNYMAERNNVALKDLRLYVWPTRKIWEERRQMWRNRVVDNERKAREEEMNEVQNAIFGKKADALK